MRVAHVLFVGGWVGHSPFKVWLHWCLARLPRGWVPPSFVKHSGAFWVNSIVLKTDPCKDGSIGVPMAVALFNGADITKYCGAPKDKQSQQSLASWGLVSLRRWWVALRTWYRWGSKWELTLQPGLYCQQAEPDILGQSWFMILFVCIIVPVQ